MGDIVLFLFSVCGWDITSVFRHLGRLALQQDKWFHAAYVGHLWGSAWQKSVMSHKLNRWPFPLDPRPHLCFYYQKNAVKGSGPPKNVVFWSDPETRVGDESGTFSPQLCLLEGIPVDVYQDKVKPVPRALEIVLIWSGISPNKNTAFLK